MLGVKFETNGLERYLEEIKLISRTAAKKAAAETLTKVAKDAHAHALDNIESLFTIRNKHSARGIRMYPAKASRSLNSMNSVVGSIDDHMALQELGGAHPGTDAGHRISTARASGEGDKAAPRRKLPRGASKLGRSRTKEFKPKRQSKGNRDVQQKVVTALMLNRDRKARAWMKLDDDRVALMRAIGGRKRFEIKAIHIFSENQKAVKPRPWLQPAAEDAMRKLHDYWSDAFGRAVLRGG